MIECSTPNPTKPGLRKRLQAGSPFDTSALPLRYDATRVWLLGLGRGTMMHGVGRMALFSYLIVAPAGVTPT
jgi:hypothetical protein